MKSELWVEVLPVLRELKLMMEKTIVVDFKFGKPKDEHHVQVRQYMQLLEGMEANQSANPDNGNDSHPMIEGYLWYVYPNKIVKVEF